ncbi:MAG: hypothetical protein Q9224_006380, partial [Gallowayella concinna]
DTYLARLDCTDQTLLEPRKDGDELHLAIFLRRLNDDDQYARVRYEGQTFTRKEAAHFLPKVPPSFSRRNPEHEHEQQPSYIQVSVRQENIDPLDNVLKPRLNGFRIASKGCLQRSNSGDPLFRLYGCEWRSQESSILSIGGHRGHVADLDLRPHGHAVHYLRLGFDLAYNPVCFLVTADGMKDVRKPHLNESWTVDELEQKKSVHDRTPFDRYGWSEMTLGGYVFDLRKHPGLWALKGDRVNGLKTSLYLSKKHVVSIARIMI